jgi:hypothetical protein
MYEVGGLNIPCNKAKLFTKALTTASTAFLFRSRDPRAAYADVIML